MPTTCSKNGLINETYECRLTTLSSVLRAHNVKRIDLLKIDVQKSELDILQGVEERTGNASGRL